MEWVDEGIVLAARPHGETSSILEAFTFERGRHAGLLKGGRASGRSGWTQPGARLVLRWKGRLEHQLGAYVVEPEDLSAARLLNAPLRLAALASLLALVREGTPEREPHPALYAALRVVMRALIEDAPGWPAAIARFELALLSELGHGLDLSRCAVTGAETGLAYVSPKSGRAVTREGAGEWAPRLLPLPAFLLNGEEAPDAAQARAALALTGTFLERRLFAAIDRPPPEARRRFALLFEAEP